MRKSVRQNTAEHQIKQDLRNIFQGSDFMGNAIHVNNLSKEFGTQIAVNNVNFILEEGEIFGFLGPNGAGKTTTIKLLNGMVTPTYGSMSVFGVDPTADPEKIHQVAGVLTEHAQMYNDLTGLENLIFYGEIFGLEKDEAVKRAENLLTKLDLTDAKDKKLSDYSTGMRQRLSLARALIHSPKLLFLDEPTSGLDPESSKTVNNLIKDLAKEHKTTVFLCTHQLRYAEEICTSYGLIDKGVMFAHGTLDELRDKVSSCYKLTIKSDLEPVGVEFKVKDEDTFEIEVETDAEVAKVVADIVKSNGSVFHVSTRQLSLEDIYFALTRRQGGFEND